MVCIIPKVQREDGRDGPFFPIVSVAGADPGGDLALDGLRAAGFRGVILLPPADRPGRSGRCGTNLPCLRGGLRHSIADGAETVAAALRRALRKTGPGQAPLTLLLSLKALDSLPPDAVQVRAQALAQAVATLIGSGGAPAQGQSADGVAVTVARDDPARTWMDEDGILHLPDRSADSRAENIAGTSGAGVGAGIGGAPRDIVLTVSPAGCAPTAARDAVQSRLRAATADRATRLLSVPDLARALQPDGPVYRLMLAARRDAAGGAAAGSAEDPAGRKLDRHPLMTASAARPGAVVLLSEAQGRCRGGPLECADDRARSDPRQRRGARCGAGDQLQGRLSLGRLSLGGVAAGGVFGAAAMSARGAGCHVRARGRWPGIGFSSGNHAATGAAMAGYSDLNTNGVTLQAIAHRLRHAGLRPMARPQR